MLKTSKLRRRQEEMRKRQPGKPYRYYREDQEEQSRLRLHKMFGAGLSDARIAEVTGMSEEAVRLIRTVTQALPPHAHKRASRAPLRFPK